MADGSVPVLEAVLRFALFATLALVLPGVALQRMARVRPDPALVLPLGALFCSVAYYVALRADEPLLFPLLTAATAAGFAVPAARAAGAAAGPSLRGAVVPFAVLVALFAATQYRVNRVAPDGTFLVDVGEHQDTALHVGLTFELVAGFPPQVPGLAGVPLRYHVGAHLVRAAAVRWAGVHPYDLLSRLEITLWAAGLVLALRAAAQAMALGRVAVALAGFLPLAADLSFVPGLWLGASYWAFKLGDAFVEAVFYANSIAPAMMLVLAAIVALHRHASGEGRGWLVLAGALSGGVAQFKVFTGAQLVLAAATAWVVRHSRPLLALAIPAALAVLLLVLSSGGHGTAPPVVALEPFAPANPAREAYGLAAATGLGLVVSGLAWIVLSLGLRAAGLPGAWRALRGAAAGGGGTGRAADAGGTGRPRVARAVAGAFALWGWPLALLVSIRADPDVDESFYFLQASGLVLWLFAAPVVASLARRSVALAAVAAAVALVPAAEFVVHKAAQEPLVVPAASVRAMAALRAASCPGDVVLSRVRIAKVPLPVVLAGRRVALADYIGYWRQFTTLEALDARRALVKDFFQARDRVAAEAVAARLGAGYVYLHGTKAPVEDAGALVPLFAEGDERVYRIGAEAPAVSCPAGAK